MMGLGLHWGFAGVGYDPIHPRSYNFQCEQRPGARQ